MARKRTPIPEIFKRLDAAGLSDIADSIRDVHRLAASIKQARPRIKMTTAYKLAENIQAAAVHGPYGEKK